MVNQQEDLVTRARVLSERINKYLESYLEKSQELGKTLTDDKDEEGNQLLAVLEQRQELIEKYDVLKKEYNQLLKLLGGGLEQSSTPNNKELTQELQALLQRRESLLGEVSRLEEDNTKLLQHQFENQKVKIKAVNEGKRLLKTYFGPSILQEGVFIDKRE